MVKFNQENHTYTDTDTNKVLVPMTTLLRMANISPNYDFVNEQVLAQASERGTIVHKEIEDYIKQQEIGFTKELNSFIDYCNENKITPVYSELMVYNDVVGGTIDFIAKDENGKLILADFKTTSALNRESVQWQTSGYRYLFEQSTGLKIEKQQVWHFNKDGSLDVIDLTPIADSQVERLFDWCRNNDNSPFNVNLPTITSEQLQQMYDAEQIVKSIDAQLKKAKADAEKMRESIIASMKEIGISKFSNDSISISIVAPIERKTFDTEKFKMEHNELYNEYIKTSLTKESVRITIKKGKE